MFEGHAGHFRRANEARRQQVHISVVQRVEAVVVSPTSLLHRVHDRLNGNEIVATGTNPFRPTGGRLTDQLCLEDFCGNGRFDLFREGHAAVADQRAAELLLEEHAFGSRSGGDSNGIGQQACPARPFFAGGTLEKKLYSGHRYVSAP